MRECHRKAFAQLALAKVGMAIAIRAERRRRIVDVQAAQPFDPYPCIDLSNQRIELRGVGDVDAGDVGMTGVNAETQPWVVNGIDDARQFDWVAPDRAAGACRILEQEPRAIESFECGLQFRHDLRQRRLEPTPLVGADVQDDAIGSNCIGDVDRIEQGRATLLQQLGLIRGQVDEVDRVAGDVLNLTALARGAQYGEVLWLVCGRLPRARTLNKDLNAIGTDRRCALRHAMQSARRRDVSASNHSASIGVAPAAT